MSRILNQLRLAWPRRQPRPKQALETSIGGALRLSESAEFEAALVALSPEQREHRLQLRRQAEHIARRHAVVEAEREADRRWLKA